MSMVSHAVGARFISLIGGSMLSFYDWYADLPVASPQVFGDQTDVPESADWFDAGYLIMWGSNVPVTRTPDAHYMTEARYRGQKVVVVSPDYADNTKFADEWLPARPGTDAALAMSMGHVILTEFFVERSTPYFTDYVKRYTDLPFLITINDDGTPGKFLTAADLGGMMRKRRLRLLRRYCSTPMDTQSCRTARWDTGSPPPARATGTSTCTAWTPCSRCTAMPTTSPPCSCLASTAIAPAC
jgi:nitrate reductase alpha subunit